MASRQHLHHHGFVADGTDWQPTPVASLAAMAASVDMGRTKVLQAETAGTNWFK